MSLMDLKSQDSICCSKDFNYIYKEKESLILGKDQNRNYIIYLYFNLPPYSYLKKLKQARLILFKLPANYEENQAYANDYYTDYHVYPLLDFFSIYSYQYHAPSLDSSRRVSFKDNGYYSYSEIDITSILEAWKNEEIENKGIILMAGYNAQTITYVSNNYGATGMQPRLRLIYEDSCICPPLSEVTCKVEIWN